MSLQKNIYTDLQISLKEKDQIKLGTLRMLKSALENKSIELKKKELSDEEVVAVLRKEVKKRQDSITAFKLGNRQDLIDKERGESDILSVYLPSMISENDLKAIVDEVVSAGNNNFGQVMKEVMAKTKGAADGNVVQRLVKERIGA